MSPNYTAYETGTSLDWDGDTEVCLFKLCYLFCWVPNHIGIWSNEKADSAAKSELDLSRAKVGVPYNVSAIIFFPLGKMTRMVRTRTNFILSSHSWVIGSPPTLWCNYGELGGL